MKAEVNVRNDSGVRLPQLASNNVAYSTDVFHSTDESADARVQAIIAANDSARSGKGWSAVMLRGSWRRPLRRARTTGLRARGNRARAVSQVQAS